NDLGRSTARRARERAKLLHLRLDGETVPALRLHGRDPLPEKELQPLRDPIREIFLVQRAELPHARADAASPRGDRFVAFAGGARLELHLAGPREREMRV